MLTKGQFRRGSAEGLSLAFLIVWLAGDVFNVLGAVLQGVLPTMVCNVPHLFSSMASANLGQVILAVYYSCSDLVLLFQCLYYKRLNSRQPPPTAIVTVDGSHLSPATPLLDPSKQDDPPERPQKLYYTILFNTTAVLTVCAAGILGWWINDHEYPHDGATLEPPVEISFSTLGQVFGYLCAILYLASRLPQIMLNYQRKSCDGISLLFFLFACLGNLTYVVSIVAYVPHSRDVEAARDEYRRYIAVNASWLLGSFGTLGLDLAIFVQFFWYRDLEKECDEWESGSESGDGDVDLRVE